MSQDRRSARQAGGQTESGLSGVDLAESAWRAFRHARDGVGFAVGPRGLGDIDDGLRERFLAGVAFARKEAERSGEEEGVTFSGTARGMATILYGETYEPNAGQLATVEAVARHVVNALDYDAEEDGRLGNYEGEWRTWAAQKAGLEPAPTQLRDDDDEGSGDEDEGPF